MGKTVVLPKTPHGKSWSYTFNSAGAAGTISVAFETLKSSIAVIFMPPDEQTKKIPKTTPLVGIQVFDTSGGKAPLSGNAKELTEFGDPKKPKDAEKLILTIKYSKLDTAVIKKLYLSGENSSGKLVTTTIDLSNPAGADNSPFRYTAKKEATKSCQIVLKIAEWPKGDPLISHG
jgi:hypothetical protein